MGERRNDESFEDYDPRQLYSAESGDSLGNQELYAAPERTRVALTGMILGIISILINLGGLVGLAGLALSIWGLRKTEEPHHRGFAIAGIITSSLGTLIGILGLILLFNTHGYY